MVQHNPPTSIDVLPFSRAPRMQSSLDSGTPPQFGCNKGVVRSTLQAGAFWPAALHIKQAGLSVSAQAAATKSKIPSFEHSEDPHSGVLHRERLTTNTKQDSSIHVSEKEATMEHGKVKKSLVITNNLCSCRPKLPMNLLYHSRNRFVNWLINWKWSFCSFMLENNPLNSIFTFLLPQ